MVALQTLKRHQTYPVDVGGVIVGGSAPIAIQSMTNTDTADIEASVSQVIALFTAGSEIVRLTVNTDEAAAAIPKIKDRLLAKGIDVPLAGCFHYNGHQLLQDHPACAEALAKYRINPGNVGFGKKKDKQYAMMIEAAIKYKKPVRIGVNWGSLDQSLTKKMMDENGQLSSPKPYGDVMRAALVKSCLESAYQAEQWGLKSEQVILSAKVSRVQDLVVVYRALAAQSNYALHLGLTEAGMGTKGIAATTAALSILLQEGIGDTIRASLTPRPNENRTNEVKLCQEILQSLGVRAFKPMVTACPGCGRTTSTYFQELAEKIEHYIEGQMPVWRSSYVGVENLKVAVMGCIVNGPGESKHADIGISLPGTGEAPVAPVFIDGKKSHTLRGDTIAQEFQDILTHYVQAKYPIRQASGQ